MSNKNKKVVLAVIIAAVAALIVGVAIAVISALTAEKPTEEQEAPCEHHYIETTVELTKETDGYTLRQCTKCNYSYKTNFKYATGSEGLKYAKSTNGKHLLVTGMGTCTDEEVIIPAYHEGIQVLWIAEESFKLCENVKSIKILGKLDRIGYKVFAGCKSLEDIYYAGTKADWEALPKGADWDQDMPAYTVHCSDGDITK